MPRCRAWCVGARRRDGLADDPLHGVERRPQPRHGPRALDPDQVETTLRGIRDVRDHALFWLIYDGGLRCNEALAINLEDIDWSERAIRIQGKGDHGCEMFFSRRVSRYLDDYLKQRGQPTVGSLFITARKARSHRRADLTADGHVRLSYRQADTPSKKCTPGWDLHQLRHTAISARAAHGYKRDRTQALQRASVAAQPGGVHRPQSRGRQKQGARLGAPRSGVPIRPCLSNSTNGSRR
jgi:integrase/recombinase XerD